MATSNPTQGLRGPVEVARKVTGLFIVMAVLFIILGILAIAWPGLAGVAVTFMVGWLLIFGGVAHIVSAFGGGGFGHVIWQLIIGVVYGIGGFYFLTHPLLGLGTLTLLLAGIILAEGVIELIAFFKSKGTAGSGWMIVNALVTLFLGGLIWFHWPSSSTWAIGIIVGVNLLMTGITRLMFAMAVKKLLKHVPAQS